MSDDYPHFIFKQPWQNPAAAGYTQLGDFAMSELFSEKASMTLQVTHDYENVPPIFGANEEIYEDSGTKAFNF